MGQSPVINLSAKPTLPLLTFIKTSEFSGGGLRIIERIGTKHRALGVQLLDDKQGEVTDVLVANHPNDVNEVTRDIFKKWLTTRGRRPITWATFIAVLKEIGVNQLAQDIEKLAGIETELVHAQSHQQSEDTHSDIDMSLMKTQSQDMENGSSVPVTAIDDVKATINELTKQFIALKAKIRHSIEEHNILVDRVADVLTSLSPDEEEHHKMFARSHVKEFVKAENILEVFLIMNPHWNYLDPSLLSHLVDKLELDDVKSIAESYKSDIQRFRKKTPLKLFYQTQRKRNKDIPSGFTTIEANFKLPEPVMLEDVEQFRQEYASEYGLHDFAMMLIQVRPGCFVAVWIVPNAIVEKLKGNIPTAVLSKHKVQRLTVDGTLVYSDQLHESESLDEHISSPVLYESYYICDEGWSEEETLEASNLPKPSLNISVTPPRTLPAVLDTPLAIQVSSHSEDRTPVPESRTRFKFDLKEHIPLPSLDDASPPLSTAIDEPPVTDSSSTSLAEDEAIKVPQVRDSSHEAESDVALSLSPTTSVNTQFSDTLSRAPATMYQSTSSLYQEPLLPRLHMNPYLKKDPGESSYLKPRPQYSLVQRHPPEPTPDSGSVRLPVLEEYLMSSKLLTSSSQEQRTEEKLSTAKHENALSVQCHEKRSAPIGMYRGSATSDDQFTYFTPFDSSSLYQYEYSTEKWEALPQCPYRDSGLAIINGELTTVGGADLGHVTNKLMTLQPEGWIEEYPPMKTGRYRPVVVTTSDGNYLFVIGGRVGGGWSATVELFQVKTREWYTVTHLPKPLYLPSATICGDQLNVIGEDGDGFSLSLQDLPSSDQPFTSPLILSWTPLPPLPVKYSTAATLCGQLVLIGGIREGSTVNSIHQLVDGQWIKIGSMAEGRWGCLVVNQSPDKILIIGGVGAENSVEECTAVVV